MEWMCQGPGVQVVAAVPAAGPVPPPQHRSDAIHHRIFRLLGRDEVDMGIDSTRSQNHVLTGYDFRRRTDRQRDVRLDVGIARFADPGDLPVLQADVSLDDAPVVDDYRVSDDRIHHLVVIVLRLPHAVAYHLAAPEFHFLAISGEILLDFDHQFRISQANTIPGRGAHQFSVSLARNL